MTMCTELPNLVEEFDIANFQKGKNYVIEASAGTGKTYTIVEIVKKLLEDGITLDKMIIVTYTEKAAGELKDRIRTALTSMPESIRNDDRNDVDNASIGTIHSFCQNIVSEYFISAVKPSCQKLIDQGEIREFLKRYIRKGAIYREICEYKRNHIDKNIEDKLAKTIAAYIEKYYLDSNGNEIPTIATFNNSDVDLFGKTPFESNRIQNAIRVLEGSSTEKVRAFAQYIQDKRSVDFSDFRYDGKKVNVKSFPLDTEQEAYGSILEVKQLLSNPEKLRAYFINCITFKYLSDIYKAWQKEKENLCKQTYNDMIRNVREEVVNGRELLFRIKDKYSYAIIDEFQDTNQKQWDIFKTAFLTEGHNLIVVGDPKQSIYSFQGADVSVYKKAVDEIKKLGGESRSLRHNYRATKDIVQSANTFFDKESNKDALPQDITFNYSEVGNPNFKVQYCGKPTNAFWITNEEVSSESYAKIICNRIVDFCTKDENGATRLQIWDKDGNQRSVSFKDFAVLARTRSEMAPIQKAFEKCGIPYTQYKDNKLFSGKECANWLAILEAIQAPDFTGNNRSYFRKAMFTYFFGYSFNSIRSSEFDKDSGNEIEMFANWRELATNREWAKLIERVIDDSALAEKLQSLGDIKTFGVLLQIGGYCVDYLTRTNNLEMLIQNLRKQASADNDEDDDENSGMVAKSTDFDCVQIMTIHASKGLEFPIVISVAGFVGENKNVVNAYTYHGNENHYLTFYENDLVKKERKEEYQRLFYVAYTRAKYILMLPLYDKKGVDEFVGQTILNYKMKKDEVKENAIFDYQPMPLDDDSKTLEELKDAVKQICSGYTSKSLDTGKFDARIDWLKKEFAPTIYWHISHKHAYSSLSHCAEKKSHYNDDTAVVEEDSDTRIADADIIENDVLKHNNDDEIVETGLSNYDKSAKQIDCSYGAIDPISLSENFIAGASLGNALHKIFELIDYTKDNQDIDGLIAECFEEKKISCKAEWITDVKKMVQSVLNAKLPTICGSVKSNDDFSLKEISLDERKNEVEFNFNIPKDNQISNYMNGFVDLIFKRGEFYSILDWKSDKLNEDNFTHYNDGIILKKHVDELYSIQRVLYSYCLIKWLKQFYKDKSEQDIFSEHFGGIYYVFLRGCNPGTGNGIYAQTWENYDALEKEYQKIVKERVY